MTIPIPQSNKSRIVLTHRQGKTAFKIPLWLPENKAIIPSLIITEKQDSLIYDNILET